MRVRINDPALCGEWRMLAATSGQLDSRPRVEAATVALSSSEDGSVPYTLSYRTRRCVRTTSGIFGAVPRWNRVRTWRHLGQWLLISSLRGQIHLAENHSVAAIVTRGSIVMDSGLIVLARGDVSDDAAWTTIMDDMSTLQLTPLAVRELSWRVKAPGTDPHRYAEDFSI